MGKSTLFNRIVGARQAVTSREPGTTRDRVVSDVKWNGKQFTLIDTAGFLLDFYGFKNEEIEKMSQGQIDEALSEADLVLVVVSYKDGILEQDKEILKKARKTNKKIILICNKADNLFEEQSCENFRRLGVEEIFPLSALRGRRVGQLLDRLVRDIEDGQQDSSGVPKMSIIGRPNVGKSTLFNLLSGKSRAIVSDIAGTTRDSINETIEIGGRQIEIVDTAGLRRRGRREVGVEKFSVYRTLDAVSRSDLVLLLVDAEEGVTRGDAHLAQLALDKEKKVIIVINKIDHLKKRLTTEVKNLYRYKFLTKIKSVAISAKTSENIEALKREIAIEI